MVKKLASGIKINTQHEYIRLNLGNSRGLTVSYSGLKASGAVPDYVFKAWMKANDRDPATLATIGVTVKASVGEIVEAFAEHLPTLWPEWNDAGMIPKVGDTVRLNFGPRSGGIVEGEVTKVRGSSVTARYPNHGLVRCAADMLEA